MRPFWLCLCAASLSFVSLLAAADELRPVRIAKPIGGHIHPAACVSPKGTIVVSYGQINHRDLRISRSTDGGQTWTDPVPFEHTIKKTYYPGSLTTLRDGRLMHAWNRWSGETNELEPRSVLYSLSEDDGVTWTAPKPLPRTENVMSVIRHPIVELEANRWLVSLSDRTFLFDLIADKSEPFGDGRLHGLVPIVRTPKGTFISGAGLRSTDEGKTWAEIEKFPNLKEQGWRHEMVCLSNGWLLASEILGPGIGGERIRYVISRDDGITWNDTFEYHNPSRPIGGRACPRTVELDAKTIGVVFYDVSEQQEGGPSLFFLRIPLAKLSKVGWVKSSRPTTVDLKTADATMTDAGGSRGLDPPYKASGRVQLITGPNMAGKSTYIRQAALLTIMAQMGSFIPASEALIGIADRIFARVGASDELSKGQSTFMVEMTETARILNSASDRSLVILDEIGRGTSTYDGISLAWAVTEFLHDQIRCRTLFATHYHELTELTKTLPDTSNWNVAIREHGDDIVFLHKIVEGPADKSYGIHVAKIAGLPRDVVERASVILAQLESDHIDESGKVKIPERKKKSRDRQLSLFIEPDHPVIEKLKSLDIEQLTPIAALQKLNEFRQELAK